MAVAVRFAPSPTGFLQPGNGRAAVLNALFALKEGGHFLLRIDDTDDTRSSKDYEAAIFEDMAWLGIRYDHCVRQSERTEIYRHAAESLKASGKLYPCYETSIELERSRKRRTALKQPPVYDRAALNLSPADRERLQSEGRRPYWRFQLSHRKIVWNDLVRGQVEIDTSTISDPVLIREDGRFLYTLPSVVDDAEFQISHVIRGEDHVTNTASQIEIFEALSAPRPSFAHYPLFIAEAGEVLSKRLGSLTLRALRDEGIEAMTFDTYVAKIGTSDPLEPHTTLPQLAHDFAFQKIGRALAHFNVAELRLLNARTLHALSYEQVAARLAAMGIQAGAPFWEAARSNLRRLDDVATVWQMVHGPVCPVLENPSLAAMAAALLPAEPWDEQTWAVWTENLSAQSGAKGRALFHPLRMALTGTDHGPELKKLLPLIGRAKAEARLKGITT